MRPAIELTDAAVSRLSELIRANHDSYRAFQAAADAVDDPQLAALFQDLARQRRTFAEELRAYVDGAAPPLGQPTGARDTLHRWWVDLRARLTGSEEYALLADAEQGEDQIRDLYDRAQRDLTAGPAAEAVQRQAEAVRRSHDRIRDLRNIYAER